MNSARLIPAILGLLVLMRAPAAARDTGAEIRRYIAPCQLMLFAPSAETLITNARALLSRFYGKNYQQMALQISTDSRSSYGIDVLDPASLKQAGMDVTKPVAFVHVSNKAGYLLVPVASRKTAEAFLKKNLGTNASGAHRFYGNYLAFSDNAALLGSLTNRGRLDTAAAFEIARSKLEFQWDRVFVWVESRYFSVVTASVGVSDHVKIPYGFSAFTAHFAERDRKVTVRNYSGILSTNQTDYIRRLRDVNASPKFEVLDNAWGHPAIVGHVYLNMPMLYRYYTYIDSLNILGLKGLVQELRVRHGIDLEKNLIDNSDGRLNVVIDRFDSTRGDYVITGSVGVKDPRAASAFMDSIRETVTNTNVVSDAFDLFTRPFHHYRSSNYSLYYGVVENDFLFSTDRDTLVQLVKNVFAGTNNYVEDLPWFMKDALREKTPGYSLTIDVQSFLTGVKTGLEFNREFLVGIRDIHVYGHPDGDDKPAGWNTTVDINFYK